jgi:hypothetical protein
MHLGPDMVVSAIILALKRLRQEDVEFKASLSYKIILSPKKSTYTEHITDFLPFIP